MAPYPRKLTRAEFLRRNPGGNYDRYLYAYDRRKARRQATGAGKAADPFAALLAPGPQLPTLDLAALQAQANQMAQQQLAPQLAMLQGEAGQLQSQLQSGIGLIQGLAGAAGRQAQNIAPRIQDAYQGAATSQAGFARGFADGLREIAEQEAAKNQAQLGIANAPAEQIAEVSGVGRGGSEALYADQGYIPASSMGREGAAYTAWAEQLPAVMQRMGQWDASSLAAGASQARGALSREIAGVAGQAPGMAAGIVNDLIGQQYHQYELARSAFEADREWQLMIQGAQELANAAGLAPGNGPPLTPAANGPVSTGGGAAATTAPAGPKKPGRATYLQSINKAIPDLFDRVETQVNKARREAWESGGNRYLGPSSGEYKPRAPSYNQALTLIYGALLDANKGPRDNWRYGIKGATVNQMIRKYLKKKGLKPVAKPGVR